MKYFIGLQKKKKILVTKGFSDNFDHARALNAQLMELGYILTSEAVLKIATNSVEEIDIMYNDLIYNIRRIIPNGDSFKTLFNDFPNIDTKSDTYREYVDKMVAIYMAEVKGNIEPVYPDLDPSSLQKIGLLDKKEFDIILDNIVTANSSISAFDKEIVAWFIDNDAVIPMDKIKFNETLAYVGSLLLEKGRVINVKNATNILRIWSAYSGGDVGLKTNVKFKRPNNAQRKILLTALDKCYNLEEAFKIDRERWLRVLFYLNPMSTKNKNTYPNVYKWVVKLRNTPKELKTFNSKVETFISNKDPKILDLLPKKMGVFSRRLDHMIRLFGDIAVTKWLAAGPNAKQLIDVYNHLYGRDKKQARSSVLANDYASNVVTYKAQETIPTEVINSSRAKILEALKDVLKGTLSGKSFIDPLLYTRPLATNNRASSFSLTGVANGSVESIPSNVNIVRMYAMWSGRNDIDLSGWALGDDMHKVGYAGSNSLGRAIVYSGDNTGLYAKNAEYIDIDLRSLPPDIEWVVSEARSFSGGDFCDYNQPVYAGWMEITSTENKSKKWLPTHVNNAIVLGSKATTAYLAAFHVQSRSVVYLDVAIGNDRVSSKADMRSFKTYLDTLNVNVTGEKNWDKLCQGHILELASESIVENAAEADKVWPEHTPSEEVSSLI